MTKTKYDDEINKLLSNLEIKEEQSKKTYKELEKIESELKVLRNKQLLESGLLKKYTWRYEFNYSHGDKNCITLTANTHYWQELEEITGEKSYHWDHTIVKGELMTSGDDGTIALHIKHEFINKWIKKLGLKIDVNDLNKKIAQIDYEIQNKNKVKSILTDLIQAVGGEVTGIDKDEYDLCPCWCSPSDPDECKGSCEGKGGECIYPSKEKNYETCEHFGTGCKQCGYDSCKFSKKR
jgi:hypothetical protein